jgi:hypothetical protein
LNTRNVLAGILGLSGLLVTSMAISADEPEHSGFLGDDAVYAQLQEVEIRKGDKAMRWIGPALNFSNYQSVLVDDVVLYPEPEPGPQVSAETLEQISEYLSAQLKEKIGGVLKLAEAPGPGVVRIEPAVTGVLIKTEGMKAYEIVPVAAVFGGLKAATGKRDRNVKVFVEARLVDSQSGELLGAVLREVKGEDLKGKKDELTLEDVQENLDTVTDDASAGVAGVLDAPED